MNRKEITESRAYQISKAALEHASRSKNVVEAFEAGAEWADKTMIERTVEWLKDMACYYAHWEYNGDTYEKEIVYDTEKLIEDFKKYMRGE